MKTAITILSIGFILGRLVPPLFNNETRIQPVASNVEEQQEKYISDGSLQIYYFKSRPSGTNVIFTLRCTSYGIIDIGEARLRTRLCPIQNYDGEWEWVTPDRIRVERTGDNTIEATVVYPHNPEKMRRDFQFVAESEVEKLTTT